MLLRDGRQIGQLFCAFWNLIPRRNSRCKFGAGAQGLRPNPSIAVLRSSQMMNSTLGRSSWTAMVVSHKLASGFRSTLRYGKPTCNFPVAPPRLSG
jgi:hypothetical protein